MSESVTPPMPNSLLSVARRMDSGLVRAANPEINIHSQTKEQKNKNSTGKNIYLLPFGLAFLSAT